MLLPLLRWKLAARLRGFLAWFSEYTLQGLVYAALVLAFWAFCYGVVHLTVGYVNAELALIGPFLLDRMLAVFLLAVFIMLIYANLISAFSVLFASEDLPLLLSAPTASSEVFRTKVWESLFLGSWTYLAFGLPIFVAYGRALHAPPAYYLLALAGAVPFAALAGLLGVVGGVFLGRFNRKRRIRLAALLFWILVALLIYSLRDVILAAPRRHEEAAERLVRWEETRSIYMPHLWMFHLIKESLAGRMAQALTYLGLLGSAAVVAYQLVSVPAGALYLRVWQASQEASQDALASRPGLFFRLALLPARLLRHSAQSVVVKDVRLFFRDITQWGQMLIVLGLLALYVLQLSAARLEERPQNLLNVMVMLNQGVLGFVICALAIRFVFPSLSLEGRAIWTLASSSLSLRELFRIKWRFHLFWVCLLALALLFPAWRCLLLPLPLLLAAAGQLLLLSVGSVSLCLGVAALYPRFYARNAAEINSGTGAMICIILMLTYLSLTTACFIAPMVPARAAPDLLREAFAQPLYLLFTWGIGLFIHLAAITIPFVIGQRRLENTPL